MLLIEFTSSKALVLLSEKHRSTVQLQYTSQFKILTFLFMYIHFCSYIGENVCIETPYGVVR